MSGAPRCVLPRSLIGNGQVQIGLRGAGAGAEAFDQPRAEQRDGGVAQGLRVRDQVVAVAVVESVVEGFDQLTGADVVAEEVVVEQRDALAASNFARFAIATGIERIVYLGGLGDRPASRHLRSRLRVGEILRDQGPPLTWFRAGMVVGAGSESYRTLRSLVERLPVMLAPSWLATPTQAIAIGDVLRYLIEAPDILETSAREIQIGSAEILTYGEMLDQMADALGLRRRPRIPVPLLTPWLSSHWIGLITPVDAGVARPLIEGLSTDTTITDPSGIELFDIQPRSFEQALREAITEENQASPSL